MVLIAQISDLHLRPRGVPAYRVSETNMFAERAVESLLALSPRPDAVVVTGDVADGWLERELVLAHELLGRLPMPVYPIAGNHDDPALMRKVFTELPVPAGADPARLFYAADIGPVRLIALDSSVRAAAHGALSEDQLAFLDQELARVPGRPAIIAIHHPPIRTGVLGMDRDNLRDAEALGAVIKRHPHVARILCGHLHRAIVGEFVGRPVIVAPSVAHQLMLLLDTVRFGMVFEPPAFFLHRWTAEDGMASHLAYIERYPGPYPFYPDPDFAWPHAI